MAQEEVLLVCPEAKKPRVEIVDPLRGLAALAVAWFHFTNGSGFVKTEWLRASGRYGWLGVEVFFVISGFVIPYSMYCGGYRPRQHFGRFLAKRIARL
jgi:peptidoglycan/LPS O-acetylase OafA/YrhL